VLGRLEQSTDAKVEPFAPMEGLCEAAARLEAYEPRDLSDHCLCACDESFELLVGHACLEAEEHCRCELGYADLAVALKRTQVVCDHLCLSI
jgi:hypothetical protein